MLLLEIKQQCQNFFIYIINTEMKNKTRVVCMKILAQMLMECSFSTSVHLAHRIRRGIGAQNWNHNFKFQLTGIIIQLKLTIPNL